MRTSPIPPTTKVRAHTARLMPCCLLLALALTGCNHPAAGNANAATLSATPVIGSASAPARTGASSTAAPAPSSDLAARKGELTNPDNPTMVFLYYDLAGIAPPVEEWVEKDNRVQYARAADKATQRTTVKAAFAAGLAAVRGVGVIHLTMNANLSQYDPVYGEFTVGALSPGSAYAFQAQGQTVSLKFDNGLTAQTWSVPKDHAQAVVDRIGTDRLSVDTTLKIDKVLPSPDGGTIVTHIVSWNLGDASNGNTLARVKVSAQ